MASVEGSERDVVTCLEAGADDYMRKPFAFSELLARVRARLHEQLQDSHATLEQRVEARTRELEEQARALRRSNVELERFAYVASHDLQEPLRTIASFTELIEHRYTSRS